VPTVNLLEISEVAFSGIDRGEKQAKEQGMEEIRTPFFKGVGKFPVVRPSAERAILGRNEEGFPVVFFHNLYGRRKKKRKRKETKRIKKVRGREKLRGKEKWGKRGKKGGVEKTEAGKNGKKSK